MVSIVLPIAVLLIGAGTMAALFKLKKPPAEASRAQEEKAISVAVMSVQPGAYPVSITGYGQLKALRSVQVAAEVSGNVVNMHANLFEGGIIPEGELVLEIDPRVFRIDLEDANAIVAQLESTLKRLDLERRREAARLQSLERARDLAQDNHKRLADLIDEDVGTHAGVDTAEMVFVEADDAVEQLANTLALFPVRIEESKSTLASARAKQSMAALQLEKTKIVAPFTARVRNYCVEENQFVAAGEDLLTLVDDSILEVHLPLDSREAQKWLQFKSEQTDSNGAWFTKLKPLDCALAWTEETNGHCWTGSLHRVVAFDHESHSVTVAVRIRGDEVAADTGGGLPLVEGMHCEVVIPGRTLEDVYRLPQGTVTVDNSVHLAVDDRLVTRSVSVVRGDDDYVYVSDGLEPNDQVIATRLVNPLEGVLLDTSAATESSEE